MNTSLLLKFNTNANSKEKIIQLLSENWPLTGKEVYNRLMHEYSHEITYQGVHKALAELSEENIVEKNGSKYLLNHDWIDTNKKFFELMQERYTT